MTDEEASLLLKLLVQYRNHYAEYDMTLSEVLDDLRASLGSKGGEVA